MSGDLQQQARVSTREPEYSTSPRSQQRQGAQCQAFDQSRVEERPPPKGPRRVGQLLHSSGTRGRGARSSQCCSGRSMITGEKVPDLPFPSDTHRIQVPQITPSRRPGRTQRVGRGLVDVMSRIHRAKRPSHSAVVAMIKESCIAESGAPSPTYYPRIGGDVRPFPVPRSPQRLTSCPSTGEALAACGPHTPRCRPMLREIYILQFTRRRT